MACTDINVFVVLVAGKDATKETVLLVLALMLGMSLRLGITLISVFWSNANSTGCSAFLAVEPA